MTTTLDQLEERVRGATLCRRKQGTFTCPFHGWTFKNDGTLLKAKNEKTGAYPDGYFGTSFYTLDVSGETPLIEKKVVQLNNDYIHQVIDVYHV